MPENELYRIYEELNWVYTAPVSDFTSDPDHIRKLILEGTYNPLYPVGKAKKKLATINNRYGRKGENAIQFSTETSASSVCENRYYLACIFSEDGNPGCSFHFLKTE